MMTTSNSHIPLWQTIAAEEIQAIMKCWGCTTLSSLHKNLDPANLDPTLESATVLKMLVKLYLVAGEMFEGEKLKRIQNQIKESHMKVAAAAFELSEKDKANIEKRKRINSHPL